MRFTLIHIPNMPKVNGHHELRTVWTIGLRIYTVATYILSNIIAWKYNVQKEFNKSFQPQIKTESVVTLLRSWLILNATLFSSPF